MNDALKERRLTNSIINRYANILVKTNRSKDLRSCLQLLNGISFRRRKGESEGLEAICKDELSYKLWNNMLEPNLIDHTWLLKKFNVIEWKVSSSDCLKAKYWY